MVPFNAQNAAEKLMKSAKSLCLNVMLNCISLRILLEESVQCSHSLVGITIET